MLPLEFHIPGYDLDKELASGASGTVYRATQTGLGRIVAVKILAAGLFDEEQTRARFVREAKLQARLSHPCLLALYDAGVQAGHPYIVMELVAGGTLRERLQRNGALPLLEAVSLTRDVCAGLAVAHENGIVHRDLKPENVLLTETGQVKVAGFGLAKGGGKGTFQTSSGLVLGTPGYIAPEVIRGEEAKPAADVYAAGVLLYEMIAGCRPFEAEEFAEVLRLQLAEKPMPLGQRRSGVSTMLEELVARSIDPNPAARPSTGADFVLELDALPAMGEEEDFQSGSFRSAPGATLAEARGPASGARESARPPSGTRVASRAMPRRASGAMARPVTQRVASPPAALAGTRSARWLIPLVAVGVGLAGMAAWRGLHRQPLTKPAPKLVEKPASLPRIIRVTASSSQVHLWLDSPLPDGAALVLSGAGTQPATFTSLGGKLDFPVGFPAGLPGRGTRRHAALTMADRTVGVYFDSMFPLKESPRGATTTRVRHWVLSLPPPLRHLLAYEPSLISEVLGAFLNAVFQYLRWKAKRVLGLASVNQAYPGAVTSIQRCSSHLALNPHFHSLVTDGVFLEQPDGSVVFRELPSPTDEEVTRVAS